MSPLQALLDSNLNFTAGSSSIDALPLSPHHRVGSTLSPSAAPTFSPIHKPARHFHLNSSIHIDPIARVAHPYARNAHKSMHMEEIHKDNGKILAMNSQNLNLQPHRASELSYIRGSSHAKAL